MKNIYLYFIFSDLFHFFSNICVPTFFVISGYLFFLNNSTFILNKIKRRFKTLLIPYVISCSIFIIIIGFFQSLIETNFNYLQFYYAGEYINFLRYIYFTPAAFHMWYVRDLILIVLLSPLIYFFITRVNSVLFIVIILATVIFQIFNFLSWGIFWFAIGSYFSIKKIALFNSINKKDGIMLFILYILSIIFVLFFNIPISVPSSGLNYSALILLPGVVGLWRITDLINIDKFNSVTILKYTFFIYCFHVPLLNLIKKAFYPFIFNNVFGLVIGYLFSPIATIFILITLARFLKNKLPHSYSIITGNR